MDYRMKEINIRKYKKIYFFLVLCEFAMFMKQKRTHLQFPVLFGSWKLGMRGEWRERKGEEQFRLCRCNTEFWESRKVECFFDFLLFDLTKQLLNDFLRYFIPLKITW